MSVLILHVTVSSQIVELKYFMFPFVNCMLGTSTKDRSTRLTFRNFVVSVIVVVVSWMWSGWVFSS